MLKTHWTLHNIHICVCMLYVLLESINLSLLTFTRQVYKVIGYLQGPLRHRRLHNRHAQNLRLKQVQLGTVDSQDYRLQVLTMHLTKQLNQQTMGRHVDIATYIVMHRKDTRQECAHIVHQGKIDQVMTASYSRLQIAGLKES